MKCSVSLIVDLSFQFDVEKTSNFIGYLIKNGCCSKTINCYLSAVRMAHLQRGLDCPHLREPIVKMILKGQSHLDSLKENLENKTQRLPVTTPVMKYIKYKLKTLNWTSHKKSMIWSICTMLWNGSMRVHEACVEKTLHLIQPQPYYMRMSTFAMLEYKESGISC